MSEQQDTSKETLESFIASLGSLDELPAGTTPEQKAKLSDMMELVRQKAEELKERMGKGRELRMAFNSKDRDEAKKLSDALGAALEGALNKDVPPLAIALGVAGFIHRLSMAYLERGEQERFDMLQTMKLLIDKAVMDAMWEQRKK